MGNELVYAPLPAYDSEEIKRILNSGNFEELMLLPLSAGEYCANWKTAQDICVELSSNSDERIRANAALGLAYAARTKGRLEKHIIKPVLLKLLNECSGENKGRVIDAIEDINQFLQWNIGIKAIKRITENQM